MVGLALVAGMLLMLTATGCDTVGSDEADRIVLQPQDVTFRFQFQGGQAEGGLALLVSSDEAFMVADLLPLAYGPEDVQRVTVTEVVLERVQPLENLSMILDRATFSIDGAGDPQPIASLAELPTSRRGEMNVSQAAIGNLIGTQPFRGELAVVLLNPQPVPYVLEVQMTVQIEVLDV